MSSRAPNVFSFLLLAVSLVACGAEADPADGNDILSGQLLISVDRQGAIHMLDEGSGEQLDEEETRKHIETILGENSETVVLVQADPQAPTRAMVGIFEWLQESGAGSIGIPMGEAP